MLWGVDIARDDYRLFTARNMITFATGELFDMHRVASMIGIPMSLRDGFRDAAGKVHSRQGSKLQVAQHEGMGVGR